MKQTKMKRDQMYQAFQERHQPGKLALLVTGSNGKRIFQFFQTKKSSWSREDDETYAMLTRDLIGARRAPGIYFRVRYPKVVEFCAGSKKRAELLYPYFDKLNQFPYTSGWERRSVRTKIYVDPVEKVHAILSCAYQLQLYPYALEDYLLNHMAEEYLDYKRGDHHSMGGLEDLIAAHLDGGDKNVKEALITIINSENQTAHLTTSMIRGICKSSDKELHGLLGRLLLAARLQEGLRQAICENMDCGTLEAFETLFDVIKDNQLLRYSAVRRAVATWIGLIDPEHLTRSSDKTFYLMDQVLHNKGSAAELTKSSDAMQILVGLWGLGLREEEDAIRRMHQLAESGTQVQKRVAVFYNHCLQDASVQQDFAKKILASPEVDLPLLADLLPDYMPGICNEAVCVAGFTPAIDNKKRTDLSKWFQNKAEAEKHLHILQKMLSKMKEKKYQFDPYLFPWYQVQLTKSSILLRICGIANGLGDKALMDRLTEEIPMLDGSSFDRVYGVRLLLSNPDTPKQRAALIRTLGDKETYTRNEALRIGKSMSFSPQEYDQMCELLRFKSAELRLNVLSLLEMQDEAGIIRIIRRLLADKREEVRLAGLDLVQKNPEKYGDLISAMDSPSERERVLLEQIQGQAEKSVDALQKTEHLFTEEDEIPRKKLTCNPGDYPLYSTEAEGLNEIFQHLQDVIEAHKNDSYRNVEGQLVLLGDANQLIPAKATEDIRERTPFFDLWETFYHDYVKTPVQLMAMYLAILPYEVSLYHGLSEADEKAYNRYLEALNTEIFGNAIVQFHVGDYKNGGLFYGIVHALMKTYGDETLRYELGKKTACYLCCHVPKERRQVKLTEIRSWGGGTLYANCMISPMLAYAIEGLYECHASPGSKDVFGERFEHLLAVEDTLFAPPEKNGAGSYYQTKDLSITALDYVIAAHLGIITEGQMFKALFQKKKLRENLWNLFAAVQMEKYPWRVRVLEKYAFMDYLDAKQYVSEVTNRITNHIVSVECKRGDSLTQYSNVISAIERFYGMEHLIVLLKAMGKEKFSRYSYGSAKNETLSHLISVCYPAEHDTYENFKLQIDELSIGEKRLIELAMYAPQWIGFTEKYLNMDGLRSGAYYFMAHMNDAFQQDEKRFAAIAKYTPLSSEELRDGAFDVMWFQNAYGVLGEEKFKLLYDAAKYTCEGSRHSRARKYADAALGKVSREDLEQQIREKRNKDLLMSYPLLPLQGMEDLLQRYVFIEKFRKESRQFGAQRRNSEGRACDMALRNLATCAGYADVTRLTMVMETKMAESLQSYFAWFTLDDSEDQLAVRMAVSNEGKVEIAVKKKEKKLAAVPAAYKKHDYVLRLKAAQKNFKEQQARTRKMLEQAMENREGFHLHELIELTKNPVLAVIVENLLYVEDESGICGRLSVVPAGLWDEEGTLHELSADTMVRVAHPWDLYSGKTWSSWQKYMADAYHKNGVKQPFRQVFRELYVKLPEELEQDQSYLFAGYQIQPKKALAMLKERQWVVDEENGLSKIFYQDDIVVNLYALADWFSPADIESPTLELVAFTHRKTFAPIAIKDVPEIIYSEAMRDVELVVSTAHAGNVDPAATHSTIEMRSVIAKCNIELFGLTNVSVEKSHLLIKGTRGEYSIHLGSGVVHLRGVHQLHVLPVHGQHKGRIFLPFLDEDPKTAEIMSKMILFAQDEKIKDP